jgi:hypothetical protein
MKKTYLIMAIAAEIFILKCLKLKTNNPTQNNNPSIDKKVGYLLGQMMLQGEAVNMSKIPVNYGDQNYDPLIAFKFGLSY